ncbi:hypothetical protein HL653_10660 [Sphingomonas sp. AP4-R1]|uniref:hypothetical protein n=1 Tax=Sphingomonas sp. AP4-R1 TaxID=2735134 RepID=UPI0014938448|nr:hypothetical protein [Sphingomonas sp. AP4-R1]QJU58195.1 hypothetical protein HL653_10660 [Sphingomonas sp. AP4-R1]
MLAVTLNLATAASAAKYPVIPEPMVFDMMRPLGAKRGELEVNTLGTAALSGRERPVDWAPELEYAFADGLAIEFEFPFEDRSFVAYKLGLQAAFGTFNNGRSAHGVQYLGIYDRHGKTYRNSLIYMLGHRFDRRWSTMSMIGVGEISRQRAAGRNGLILNHSTFYDLPGGSILGLELNYLGGRDGHFLAMPQVHHRLSHRVNVQFAIGGDRIRGDVVRPKAGLRIVQEF